MSVRSSTFDCPTTTCGHVTDQRDGWLFLTGKLDQIETVLEPYKVKRMVEGNGEIEHVLEMFLLGPDGKQVRLYSATSVAPETVAADVRRELAQG